MADSFYDTLTDDQKTYFQHYKSNNKYLNCDCFANCLNEMLINDRIDPKWEEAKTKLDEIVGKEKRKEGIKLFRVTTTNRFEQFIIKKLLKYPAFMSTSSSHEAVQKHFSSIYSHEVPVFIIIDCPIGSPIAPFENSTTSGLEYEFLLGRDNSFEIIESKEIVEKSCLEQLAGRDYAAQFNKIMFYNIRLVLPS